MLKSIIPSYVMWAFSSFVCNILLYLSRTNNIFGSKLCESIQDLWLYTLILWKLLNKIDNTLVSDKVIHQKDINNVFLSNVLVNFKIPKFVSLLWGAKRQKHLWGWYATQIERNFITFETADKYFVCV